MKSILVVAAALLCSVIGRSQTLPVRTADGRGQGTFFGSTCNGSMEISIAPGNGDSSFQVILPQNHAYAALFDSSYRNEQGTVLTGNVTICSMPCGAYHSASKRSAISDFDTAPFRLSLRNVVVAFREKQR